MIPWKRPHKTPFQHTVGGSEKARAPTPPPPDSKSYLHLCFVTRISIRKAADFLNQFVDGRRNCNSAMDNGSKKEDGFFSISTIWNKRDFHQIKKPGLAKCYLRVGEDSRSLASIYERSTVNHNAIFTGAGAPEPGGRGQIWTDHLTLSQTVGGQSMPTPIITRNHPDFQTFLRP